MKLPKILKALNAPQSASQTSRRTSGHPSTNEDARARVKAELASLKADLEELYSRAPLDR